MTKEEFITHACEQVLRFTRVARWDDLSEESKVALGFNMGVVALGFDLTKEDGFLALARVRQGIMSVPAFREYMKALIASRSIKVDENKTARPF